MNARTVNALSAMAILGTTSRFAEASKKYAENDMLPMRSAASPYWSASASRQALQ